MAAVRAMHRLDEAQLVNQARHLGEQLAHPHAALAVLFELPRRLEQIECFARNHLRAFERQRLAVVALQQRLVVERIHL